MKNKSLLFIFISFVFILNDWTKELIPFAGIYLDIFRLFFVPLLLLSLCFSLFNKPAFNTLSLKVLVAFSLLSIFYFASAMLSKDIAYSIKRWAYFTSNICVVIICYIIYSAYYRHKVNIASESFNFSLKLLLLISFLVALTQVIFPELAYRPEVRTLLSLSFQRVNSFFWDPNFYSCFLATSIAYILVYEKGTRQRIPYSTYFITALAFLFMFLTGSRGGILAFVIANSFILLLNYYKGNFGKFFIFSYVLLLPAFIILFSYFDFATNIDLIAQKDDESLSALSRLLTWFSGINLWLDSPFFGIGPGNYVTYDKGAILYGYVDSWRANQIDSLAAHSNLIEILVESGIFCLLLYVYIFYKLISHYNSSNITVYACVTALTVFYTCTLFLSYFTPWLFMIVALLLYANTYGKECK
ncbi:O-antigen ligase [Pseudoalteromonas sp. P1-26]|uniref:O-antigen ligase family protein n=1 Tax=Pseudoalteromonas sp. P1-26 TaxID=1723759 RepID=UPI0006D6662F|nr:O-antigen ligase family protein [Pseudoalteromonas sp. P1-26]